MGKTNIHITSWGGGVTVNNGQWGGGTFKGGSIDFSCKRKPILSQLHWVQTPRTHQLTVGGGGSVTSSPESETHRKKDGKDDQTLRY